MIFINLGSVFIGGSNVLNSKLTFENLFKIGYRYFDKNKSSSNDLLVIKAFQRHYLQKRVTGKIDQKTLEISHFLAAKDKK